MNRENNPTKLDRILQAMDPEGRERAINLLQLYREKRKEAENKNYQGIMKKVEEQKKQPLDLERALRQQLENSKDDPIKDQTPPERIYLNDYHKQRSEAAQSAVAEMLKHPLSPEQVKEQLAHLKVQKVN